MTYLFAIAKGRMAVNLNIVVSLIEFVDRNFKLMKTWRSIHMSVPKQFIQCFIVGSTFVQSKLVSYFSCFSIFDYVFHAMCIVHIYNLIYSSHHLAVVSTAPMFLRCQSQWLHVDFFSTNRRRRCDAVCRVVYCSFIFVDSILSLHYFLFRQIQHPVISHNEWTLSEYWVVPSELNQIYGSVLLASGFRNYFYSNIFETLYSLHSTAWSQEFSSI